MHRTHHNGQRTVKLLEPRQTSSNAWHRIVTCVMHAQCSVLRPHLCATCCRLDFRFRLGCSPGKNVKPLLHLIKHSCSHQYHFFKLGALWRQSTSLCVVASKSNLNHYLQRFNSPLSLSISFQSLIELFDMYRICIGVIAPSQ